MGRKNKNSKNRHLTFASEEDKPSEPSSSNQPQTEPNSASLEQSGESNTKALEQSGDEEALEQSGGVEHDDEFQSASASYKADKERKSAQSSDDDAVRTGMKNDYDYDSFIDVIIQSLWRIRRFREEFSSTSTTLHQHVGDPCVVCDLHDIFTDLGMASTETQRRTVSQNIKTWSRTSHVNVQSLQVEQINDAAAAKVLNTILNCLHQSSTSCSKENDVSSCDCSSEDCLAHLLFGMDIAEIITCRSCTMESICRKYSSFVHVLEATALQEMQTTSSDRSLDELLKHEKMNNHHMCKAERGGCRERNYTLHIRAIPAHVFIAVLRQNMLEGPDNMSDVNAELVVDAVSRGFDHRRRYCLISMICYNGQLYSCFAYSVELGLWVLYWDATMEAIGRWGDVLVMIKRKSLQPLVLFYEAVIRY